MARRVTLPGLDQSELPPLMATLNWTNALKKQ